MIHTELLASKAGTVVREAEAVGRCINLWNNLYALSSSIKDELAEFVFRIAAILGGETREKVTLQTES